MSVWDEILAPETVNDCATHPDSCELAKADSLSSSLPFVLSDENVIAWGKRF